MQIDKVETVNEFSPPLQIDKVETVNEFSPPASPDYIPPWNEEEGGEDHSTELSTSKKFEMGWYRSFERGCYWLKIPTRSRSLSASRSFMSPYGSDYMTRGSSYDTISEIHEV